MAEQWEWTCTKCGGVTLLGPEGGVFTGCSCSDFTVHSDQIEVVRIVDGVREPLGTMSQWVGLDHYTREGELKQWRRQIAWRRLVDRGERATDEAIEREAESVDLFAHA